MHERSHIKTLLCVSEHLHMRGPMGINAIMAVAMAVMSRPSRVGQVARPGMTSGDLVERHKGIETAQYVMPVRAA